MIDTIKWDAKTTPTPPRGMASFCSRWMNQFPSLILFHPNVMKRNHCIAYPSPYPCGCQRGSPEKRWNDDFSSSPSSGPFAATTLICSCKHIDGHMDGWIIGRKYEIMEWEFSSCCLLSFFPSVTIERDEQCCRNEWLKSPTPFLHPVHPLRTLFDSPLGVNDLQNVKEKILLERYRNHEFKPMLC
jgi:hypothetical protein